MRYCKYLIIFLASLFSLESSAQTTSAEDIDITGLWKGSLYNDTTKKYYRYEIGISDEKGKLSGFSHTFFLIEDKEFYGVKKVKIKKTDGKIIIEDAGLIANNYPEAPAKGVRQLNVLTLEIKDSIMTLSGPFSTNRTKQYSSLTGTIQLQRKNDFWQSALVPHLQELGRSNDLSFVKKENDEIKAAVEKATALQEAAVKKEKEETKATAPRDAAEKKKISEEINQTAIAKNEVKKEETKTESKKAEPKPVTQEAKEPVTENISKMETTPEKAVTEIKPTQIPAEKKTMVVPREEKKIVVTKPNIPAAEVSTRATVVQQTVYFSSDSLQISLYDNGEVDGDTVSVLMNGKIIMAKERLSTNAVRKTIYASPDTDSIELIMYAENLGAIGPNTGLLVVHDGKSIYEIRFSGDLKKNASIILRRRKN